jgi:hypothetical protein
VNRYRRLAALLLLAALVPACGDGDPGPAGPPGSTGLSLPVIQSLSAFGLPAEPGDDVVLQVSAQSPDSLPLTYAWSVSPAAWSVTAGGATASATVSAPNAYGQSGSATVVVTDSLGRTATGFLALATAGNGAPVIHSITVDPNPISKGGSAALRVYATDPNGDPLAYAWTAPASDFSLTAGQGTSQATLRADAFASGLVEVEVDDGFGGVALGGVVVSTRPGWWRPSEAVGRPGLGASSSPRVRVDAADNAVRVWIQVEGGYPRVRASRRPTGGDWSEPEVISPEGLYNMTELRLAVAPSGLAVAVWIANDGLVSSVWSNRFEPATGWGTVQAVESVAPGDPVLLDVDVDPAGNAIVVFQVQDGGDFDIWANRYAVGAGWGTPQLLETDDAGGAFVPVVACDPAGNATAAWFQSDGVRQNVWAARYVAGTGWQAPVLIETDNAGDAQRPSIAADPAGNVTAAWQQFDGVRFNLWANRYTAGTGWGTAALIETDDAGDALNVDVGADAAGNVIAVWQQFDGIEDRVVAARRPAGGAWGAAAPVGTGTVTNQPLELAVGSGGDALAVWRSPFAPQEIRGVRYQAGTGWAAEGLLEEVPSGTVASPTAAVDGGGNSIAVWGQTFAAIHCLWWNLYTAGDGWMGGTPLHVVPSGQAGAPRIVLNGAGDATAVWIQEDAPLGAVLASRWTPATGWSSCRYVQTGTPKQAFEMAAEGNAAGEVVVVWRQDDDGFHNLWANRYAPATGWGIAQKLENANTGPVAAPDVAVDAAGNAIAVWEQNDGVRWNLWTNRYTAGTGWGTAELLETDDLGQAHMVDVAVEPGGTAMAVWQQDDGTETNIWARRYTTAGGWGAAEVIETRPGNAELPKVAVDPAGHATAVWQQSETYLDMWANRYTAGSGWGTAQRLENVDAGAAQYAAITLLPGGGAMVAWVQSLDGTYGHAWASRYASGSGWTAPELIEGENSGSVYLPQLASDPRGNVMAVWHQFDGTRFNAWANRWTPSAGWGPAELLELDSLGSATNPRVALDPSGEAAAVWRQLESGEFRIRSSRWR